MEGADSLMEDWAYQVIQPSFLLETQELLPLPFCTGVSSVLRLLQRAGDVDVFHERWAYFSGVSLKRCDDTADRVQGKDATRGTIDNR